MKFYVVVNYYLVSLSLKFQEAGAELCQAHASLDFFGFDVIFVYIDYFTQLISTDFIGIGNKKNLVKKMLVQKNWKFGQKLILVK